VTADDVQIDLNGFSILGQTVCSGSPPAGALTCTPIGSGRGIDASLRVSITVTGGSIDGVSSAGVICGPRCRLADLSVQNCGANALVPGDGSLVRNNTVSRNGFGISYANSGGSTIQGNTIVQNGANGITGFTGDMIIDNSVRQNYSTGISVFANATLRGNSVIANGNSGIACGDGCLVDDNVLSDNVGYGLFLNSASTYRHNMLRGNTLSNVFSGTQLGPNFCETNTSCP